MSNRKSLKIKEVVKLGSLNRLNLVVGSVFALMASIKLYQTYGLIFTSLATLFVGGYLLVNLLHLLSGLNYQKGMKNDYGEEVILTIREWLKGIGEHTTLSDYLRMKHGKSPDEIN